MITFTRCAFMAKQACATFSQVVQKITPPIANNFLKFFFALFATLTLNAATAWGAEATIYTSNVELSTSSGTKATASKAKISSVEYSAMKLGSSGNAGSFYVNLPANTTSLTLHAAAWTGKSSNKLTLSSETAGVTISPSTALTLTANSGVSGNSTTYTITPNNAKEFFTFTLTGATSGAKIKLACSERCLIWGVNAETTGGGSTPDPENPTPETGDGTWTLVTNASDLKAGDIVVIASNTKGVVASDITSDYMGQVNATFSADKSTITTLPSGAVQLTVGGTAGAWTLTYNGKQLGATALKKVAWASGTKTWSISISNNNATIQNGTSLYGRFLHNVQSTRFTTYTSSANTSMLLPQIYKKNTALTDCDNAVTISQGTLSNGSFKLDKTGKQSTCDGSVTVTLSDIQPAAGYKFSAITQTGVDASKVTIDNTAKTVTYAKNTTGTSTINVTFEQIPRLAKPTNLKVSSVSCANASLTWDAVDGTNKYKLVLTNTSKNTQTTSNLNTNSAFITLSAGVTYSWTIQAIGDGTTNTDSEVATGENFTTHYTITYNTNGGSDVEDGCGTTLPETLPTTSKNHYTFDGWYLDEKFTTQAEAGATLTKNTDLYAKWTANTYTITFKAGTGTCGTESATATNADGFTLPKATPSDVCDEVGWTFAGWATSSVAETTSAPTLLKANDKYQPTSSITLYAVYSTTETTLGEGEELSQTLKYDSWSYTGSTTDKGDYRMFHTGSYVESAPFDLSILTKVVVYGGTFGGDKYNSLTIGDGANVWKTVAVTGNSQTGVNSFTNGNALSGHGKLRITSNSGTASTNGVRISKIDIYTISSITTTTYNSNPDCTPPAEYTITWWANGEEFYTQTDVEGTTIKVPTNSPDAAVYACDDKVFVGWVDTEIIGSTDTKPSLITEFGNITEDKNFFAVFASESSTDYPTAYTAGDVGDFVLAAKNGDKWYALPTNPTVDGGKIQGVEIAVATTKGVEHVTTTNASGYTWTIANATNGQTISDGTKYIYHKNGGESDTDLSYGTGTSFTWKIEKEDAGLTFKAMNGATVKNRGMLVQGTQYGGYSLNNETTNGYYRISVLPIADAVSYSGYVTTCEAATEALSGTFSVGKYEVAQFATGNLQYKPSTKTWRFAKQQYQYVGEANINVGDPNYKGWIDMLGWSTNDADNNYGVNPNNVNDLYDGTFQDWGDLFSADENWSTLSADQWKYLLNGRGLGKKQIARVGSVVGIMLFPDVWNAPLTVTAQPDSYFEVDIHNYTLDQWAELEKAGALFLPAAGRRTGGYGNMINKDQEEETNSENLNGGHYKHQDNTNIYCYYWTSTINESTKDVSYLHNIQALGGDKYTIGTGAIWGEKGRYGQSVRLAKVTSTLIEIGGGDNSDVITANEDKTVNVKVNRTFKANDGYYTICLPFNIDADEIGKAYQIKEITEHVAGGGINVEFTEVTTLTAGQPYLLLPSENLENPVFEGVTIVNTTGDAAPTVSGEGINIAFTGIINGRGETNGTSEYYVGNKGYLYNEPTAKLGLRAFFTITDNNGNPAKVRARVVVGENTATDLDNILNGENTTIKVIENGQLIIIRNGEKFNAQGQKL